MNNFTCRMVLASALMALASCKSDFTPDVPTPSPEESEAAAIEFGATVVSSKGQTRADASLVNRHDTSLPATAEKGYYAGLFGYYTGSSAFSSESAPNLFFNHPMTIGPTGTDGTTPLTYTDKRYWPNTDGEQLSFWAYYPWNSTTFPGDYNIGVYGTDFGVKEGMGTVLFRMDPDAQRQVDFMMTDLVADKTKADFPLVASPEPGSTDLTPKAVPLKFRHLLAQVRFYAFVRGKDHVEYATVTTTDGEGFEVKLPRKATKAEADYVYPSDYAVEALRGQHRQIADEYGISHDVREGDLIPDDTPWLYADADALTAAYAARQIKTLRWDRTDGTLDVSGTRFRTTAIYSLSFRNIRTECLFTPVYDALTATTTVGHTEQGPLGTATVSHYVANPYWFRFSAKGGERYQVNTTYMYGYFEGTPGEQGADASETDGIDWSKYGGSNAMGYAFNSDNVAPDGRHYNYAPCNIIMAVPQTLNDNDVPHVVITASGSHYVRPTGAFTTETHTVVDGGVLRSEDVRRAVMEYYGSDYRTVGTASEALPITATVTVNMLGMGLRWESGFIYSYAFLEDDLTPGAEIVRGPQSISVVYDPVRWTDQW